MEILVEIIKLLVPALIGAGVTLIVTRFNYER